MLKHAAAKHIEVTIETWPPERLEQNDKPGLRIRVTDDGKGFSKEEVATLGPQGHGLRNLESRLRSINGFVKIESQFGKGTSVEIGIPWED